MEVGSAKTQVTRYLVGILTLKGEWERSGEIGITIKREKRGKGRKGTGKRRQMQGIVGGAWL